MKFLGRKISIVFIGILAVLLSSAAIFAEKERIDVSREEVSVGKCGEDAYYSFDSKLLRIYGSGTVDIMFPEKILESVEKIDIEYGISGIKELTFAGSKNLQSVTIAGSVKHIDFLAFYDCKKLKEINLSEGLEIIGCNAFEGTAIEEITLPKSMTYIGSSALYCSNLKKVYVYGSKINEDTDAPTWEEILDLKGRKKHSCFRFLPDSVYICCFGPRVIWTNPEWHKYDKNTENEMYDWHYVY